MRFQFFPLRFEFIARESLSFPTAKAGNTLRGALGMVFRRLACTPECQDARSCAVRQTCPYAQVFEPVTQRAGPSGFSDWPRPFVFRARHLDGRSLQPGESFHFNLHVFSLDPKVLSYFVDTFDALAHEGLGAQRSKAELQCVRRLELDEFPEQILYSISEPSARYEVDLVSLDLDPAPTAPSKIRVEFLSPTELKHERKITLRPEFPILLGRIRDRISTLRSLYGPGPLDIDFRGMGARAAAVRMTHCDIHREEADRRSTRTGQTHSIGGFVGVAEYEGELAEFLPFLKAGCWVGVGRQVVWGKGEIALHW
jgi:CRISPR-associated endoribonuclease Cas6